MIDFITVYLDYLGLNGKTHLENCKAKLVFGKPGTFTNEGDFIPTKNFKAECVAEYKNLKFEIFKSGRIKLSGSLHVFWNNGKHNYNNFDFKALQEVLNEIAGQLDLDLKRATIHHMEYGVNLTDLAYSASQIVQHLMIHSGKGGPKMFGKSTFGTPSEFYSIERKEFILKCYSKSKHYNLIGTNIFRVENKILKSRELKKFKINSLFDLRNSTIINILLYRLLDIWDEVLINDWTIRELELTKNQRINLKEYRNPVFWVDLHQETRTRNRNRFRTKIGLYNSIVENYSENIHRIIRDSIIQQWTNNTLGNNTEVQTEKCKITTITPKPKKSDKVQDHLYIKGDLASIHFKVCSVTGINISSQKESSHFLSKQSILKIWQCDKLLYQELFVKYGPKPGRVLRLDEETEVMAKNIRNQESNIRKTKRHRYFKFKDSLFPYLPEIPIYAKG